MKPTLVILAAGMASRYGSMKQVEGFGPGGETIMDYSIYDAMRSGFGKIVFIIRKDFAENFKNIFEPKLKGRISTEYVYQEMDAFTEGFKAPAERTKPWGTAHAVLTAKPAVQEPFAVINADDFYGKDAFQKACDFLVSECNPELYSLIGYELEKTLSEHGSVSRGVCQVDKNNFLVSINERTNIYRESGKVVYEEKGQKEEVEKETKVSMNFWCFHQTVFEFIQKTFLEFLKDNSSNPKAEFFIPIMADKFIRERYGKIKVIPTSSQWFGVTYKEDAPQVKKSLLRLIEKGEYPEILWNT
jgi:UTP-glucose-1-phosphate uridylyltransferase